jgi:hypothetical protein
MTDNFKFLIVGAGRGGTSLLASVLDHHPRLEVGFELFMSQLMRGYEDQPQQLLYQRVHDFVSACHQEAAHTTRWWGNKITVEQIHGLDDHNRLNPDAVMDVVAYFFRHGVKTQKIIFILRDGRTCVRSKMQRTGQSMEEACRRWKLSVAMYHFLRAEGQLCIKYEDLLLHPRNVLKEVCQFLGVAFDNALLGGTASTKMLAEYRQNQFDTTKLSLENIPPGCTELLWDELRACAYVE